MLSITRIIYLLIIIFAVNPVEASSLFVSNEVRLQLGEAQTHYEQAKYNKGIKVVASLLKKRRLSGYEKALAYQMQGYLYAGNNDLPKAIEAFKKSLGFGKLDEKVSLNLRFNLAQLLVAMEQYDKAIVQINIWLKATPKVSTQQRLLIASANYFAKHYIVAEKQVDTLFSKVKLPQKSTYELGLAIYVENKKYEKAINLLQRALAQYANDENFWRHLAGLYRQTHQESLAVASLQSAYELKLLKDDEIVNLAKMLFYLDAPFPAARLLQDAMQNHLLKVDTERLKLLAECWLAAREYQSAIDSFAEAASFANDGDLYLRQAEILIDQERWGESVNTLQKAFSTEKISKKGKAQLLLGIANYEAGNLLAAKDAFLQAMQVGKQKKTAKQWLSLVQSRI